MAIKLKLLWISFATIFIGVCNAVLHHEARYRRQGPPGGMPPGGMPPGGMPPGGMPPGGMPPGGFPPGGFPPGANIPPGYQGMGQPGQQGGSPAAAAANKTERPKLLDDQPAPGDRYTTTIPTTRAKRTTPARMSFEEECHYLAFYCLKAYDTGKLCGRTIYYNYQTFKNYCMMDYVNCMERYEVWQVVHMGECFTLTVLKDYQHYEYHDDLFLDQMYVIEQ